MHRNVGKLVVLAAAVAAAGALPRAANAQVTVTPQIGVYIPGNSLDSLKAGAQTVRVDRSGTLGMGLNIDFGFLRGSLAYASAAKIGRAHV